MDFIDFILAFLVLIQLGQNVQLILEQYGFKLHRSTSMQIFLKVNT